MVRFNKKYPHLSVKLRIADSGEVEAFHSLKKSFYRDLIMLAGVAFLDGWRQYRAIKQ